MKIFFVGIHNKPGMEPLDIRTKTGRIVDMMIDDYDPIECVKTNLCDMDYLPADRTIIMAQSIIWCEKYKPEADDRIILLGKWVQKNFLYSASHMIRVNHPASIYGHKNLMKYLNDLLMKMYLS